MEEKGQEVGLMTTRCGGWFGGRKPEKLVWNLPGERGFANVGEREGNFLRNS